MKFNKVAGADISERRLNFRGVAPDFRPACGGEDEDRKPSACKVLLVLKVLVCRDKSIERGLGGFKKFAVG